MAPGSDQEREPAAEPPVLTVHNRHSEGCGAPPAILAQGPGYVGYFQSRLGGQWVFVQRPGRPAELRGGDCNWPTILTVRDGRAEDPEGLYPIVMAGEEYVWLRICWESSVDYRRVGKIDA